MSIEIAGLLRAAAREEEAAAEREYPLGADTVHRYVGAARRRRVAHRALVVAAGVAVMGAAALGINQYWRDAPIAATPTTPTITRSTSQEPSETPTPTPSSTPSPSATVSPSATHAPPAPIETPPPAQNEKPVAAVPGPVTGVSAGAGGGSGEILVNWDAVADATGYRVYRSSSAEGPFVASASIAAATGVTSVEFGGSYENIQVWQPTSFSFQYVESVDNARAYFRVAAFNTAGSGPRSGVVCGSPATGTEGC